MEEVTRQVRAEASRTGHDQTPVWAGLIEGGIELPPLRPGPIFAAEFPDTTGIRVGTAIAELSAFAVPEPVLGEWRARFSELNNLQLSAVNDYRVLDSQPLLVVAPTTSGKTFVGELAAARAIADGRKAVFLLPFKALANEKYEEFEQLYGQGLGLRVLRCTGDYSDQTGPFVKGRYDVALLTYEMFLGLSVAMPTLLCKIGLVVLDEAQFITDPTRGIGVELLLTNLLAAKERGVEPQIVALSAVIGNVNHFDEWLGCQTLETNDRPVPLVEGVLDRNGTYQYLDVNGREHTVQFLQPHEIVQRKARPGSQDVIVPLVRKLVGEGEQVIVFRNMKGSSSGCANYLAADLGLPPATDVLAALPGQDLSMASEALHRALQGGTAFHTTDLSREERVIVERAYRDREGPIRVLVATSTVAAGVNTPAETVVIVETEFPSRPPETYTVAAYKNMAGRAGRLGHATRGRSILLASDGLQRARLFTHYVRGQPEPIRSSFDPNELDTWVLRLLAQVEDVPRDAVVTLLANTYAGYLEMRASPAWKPKMRADVERLLQRMFELELLEEEMGLVRLSLLGKATSPGTTATTLPTRFNGEHPTTWPTALGVNGSPSCALGLMACRSARSKEHSQPIPTTVLESATSVASPTTLGSTSPQRLTSLTCFCMVKGRALRMSKRCSPNSKPAFPPPRLSCSISRSSSAVGPILHCIRLALFGRATSGQPQRNVSSGLLVQPSRRQSGQCDQGSNRAERPNGFWCR